MFVNFFLLGIPDAITQCTVDAYSSNITITINCMKSYAQGDNDGYACTLFKYNDKGNQKMFEEIARTKSCIFALENFREPVEFRVSCKPEIVAWLPNAFSNVLLQRRHHLAIGCNQVVPRRAVVPHKFH